VDVIDRSIKLEERTVSLARLHQQGLGAILSITFTVHSSTSLILFSNSQHFLSHSQGARGLSRDDQYSGSIFMGVSISRESVIQYHAQH
jgi:hypothetical protein